MRIYEAKDYKDMSRKAANIISAQVIMKPDCTLGLATGSTPIGTYEQLVDWYNKGDIDFSEVHTANLDEYRGIERTNEQSYYYFMNHHLFSKVNIDKNHTNIPDGMNPDAIAEGARYEEVIRSLGGVDLQLLGMGHNGHIGFNKADIVAKAFFGPITPEVPASILQMHNDVILIADTAALSKVSK